MIRKKTHDWQDQRTFVAARELLLPLAQTQPHSLLSRRERLRGAGEAGAQMCMGDACPSDDRDETFLTPLGPAVGWAGHTEEAWPSQSSCGPIAITVHAMGCRRGGGDVEVVVRTMGRAVARVTMVYAMWIKEAVIIMVIVKVNKKKPSMS